MRGREQEPEGLHPFDRTRILPGVPPLPSAPAEPEAPEAPAQAVPTLSDPLASQAPAAAAPQAPGLGYRGIYLFLAAMVVAAGVSWALLGRRAGPRRALEAEPVAETLPPSLRAYREAADQGDPRAMRMLGACYTYGLGVRVNPLVGADWYRRAAQAGDRMALQELDAARSRR